MSGLRALGCPTESPSLQINRSSKSPNWDNYGNNLKILFIFKKREKLFKKNIFLLEHSSFFSNYFILLNLIRHIFKLSDKKAVRKWQPNQLLVYFWEVINVKGFLGPNIFLGNFRTEKCGQFILKAKLLTFLRKYRSDFQVNNKILNAKFKILVRNQTFDQTRNKLTMTLFLGSGLLVLLAP